MTNVLFAEPLLIAELQNFAPLTALVKSVDGMTDFDSVMQRSQSLPALFVSYAGEKITQTFEDGKTQLVQQRWGVVVAVTTAKDIHAGGSVREQAGQIMTEVGNALAGTVLKAGVSALEQLDSPAPVYKTGKAYFFMIFGLNHTRSFTR